MGAQVGDGLKLIFLIKSRFRIETCLRGGLELRCCKVSFPPKPWALGYRRGVKGAGTSFPLEEVHFRSLNFRKKSVFIPKL